jgi:hypothetical protein
VAGGNPIARRVDNSSGVEELGLRLHADPDREGGGRPVQRTDRQDSAARHSGGRGAGVDDEPDADEREPSGESLLRADVPCDRFAGRRHEIEVLEGREDLGGSGHR